jgi:DNA-directed RNA polymerase specialized sigma24 family protein
VVNQNPKLAAVAEARAGIERAKERYRKAVLEARDAGLSNTGIARAAGVTETAIRTFIQRNQ